MVNVSRLRNEISTVKTEIVKAFNERCFVCGFDCTPILAIHHIQHLSNGGDNQPDNLIPLCPNCHAIVHKIIREVDPLNGDIDIYSLSPALEQILAWVNRNLGSEAEQKLFSIARQERMAQNA